MNNDLPAHQFRKTMVSEYENFERLLNDDQEPIFIIFQPTREIRMRVAQIGSTDAGLVNIFGEDMDRNPIDLLMHFTHIAYMLEACASDAPQRIGFAIDAGVK